MRLAPSVKKVLLLLLFAAALLGAPYWGALLSAADSGTVAEKVVPAGEAEWPGGFPGWSPGPMNNPKTNALSHWNKHRKEFPEYKTAAEYVAAAHRFIKTPPPGTLRKFENNGDKLLYLPKLNLFLAVTRDGLPKTMFKPDRGKKYFDRQ